MAFENITGARVPPAAALQRQIADARSLIPQPARMMVGPLLDTFAAYVAVTEARLAALEAPK